MKRVVNGVTYNTDTSEFWGRSGYTLDLMGMARASRPT